MLITDDCYSNEFTLDCSYERTRIDIYLPCATIVKDLALNQKFVDGRFYLAEKLVTSPLSIFNESGLSGLLFDKPTLTQYLSDKGYAIIWSLYGEKRIIDTKSKSPGMLEIKGIYWLNDNDDLEGMFTTSNTWYANK